MTATRTSRRARLTEPPRALQSRRRRATETSSKRKRAFTPGSSAPGTLRAVRPTARRMARLTRREFFQLSAAAVAAAKLSAALRVARAVTPAGGSPAAVRHVVVLMQENRSFDHYFGTLRGVRGFGDRAALAHGRGHVFRQRAADGRTLAPFRSPAACAADLDHSWHGTHRAWNRGNCDRWIEAKGVGAMAHLDRAALPFHYALADAFTLCDAYFCSVMGPTKPNRLYLWSGTNDPHGLAGGPVLDNGPEDLRWTTYPERLEAAGVRWKIYQNAADNYDDNALAWFRRFRDAAPGTPLHDRGLASVPAVPGDTCADIAAALERDVRAGALPTVSWIIAPERCSEHPRHPPAAGAEFIARVLAALTADPAVWAGTVLLINYDENDGFFDHVPPPVPPPGTPDEFVGDEPIGLGPRVPLLVISPWSRGGFVCSQVFDHTSVLRFLELVTGVAEPNISAWRRRLCGDLTAAFDFTATSIAVPALRPAPVTAACAAPRQAGAAAQEPGWRPARPLPYRPEATARLDASAGRLCIEFANRGTATVHFAAYAADEPAPRHYDVDPGATPTYDVAVHGPNGFVRRFAGHRDAVGGEVAVVCDLAVPGAACLRLTLTNAAATPVALHVIAACGDAQPQTVTLAPGATRTLVYDVESYTSGDYDFEITRADDPRYLRRLAGHVETGAVSVRGSPA